MVTWGRGGARVWSSPSLYPLLHGSLPPNKDIASFQCPANSKVVIALVPGNICLRASKTSTEVYPSLLLKAPKKSLNTEQFYITEELRCSACQSQIRLSTCFLEWANHNRCRLVFVSWQFYANEPQVKKVMLMGCDWWISICLVCFACRKTNGER